MVVKISRAALILVVLCGFVTVPEVAAHATNIVDLPGGPCPVLPGYPVWDSATPYTLEAPPTPPYPIGPVLPDGTLTPTPVPPILYPTVGGALPVPTEPCDDILLDDVIDGGITTPDLSTLYPYDPSGLGLASIEAIHGLVGANAPLEDGHLPLPDHGYAEEMAMDDPWNLVGGFTTKSGFRFVFYWDTDLPIKASVHWNYEGDSEVHVVYPFVDAVDTAGIAVIDILDENASDIAGRTVEFEVHDDLGLLQPKSGSFTVGNAWNNQEGGVYNINLVIQIDSEDRTCDYLDPSGSNVAFPGLTAPVVGPTSIFWPAAVFPDGDPTGLIPFTDPIPMEVGDEHSDHKYDDVERAGCDLPGEFTLEKVAESAEIMAERIFDMTDGKVRIGQVLVTDTVLNNPLLVPSPLTVLGEAYPDPEYEEATPLPVDPAAELCATGLADLDTNGTLPTLACTGILAVSDDDADDDIPDLVANNGTTYELDQDVEEEYDHQEDETERMWNRLPCSPEGDGLEFKQYGPYGMYPEPENNTVIGLTEGAFEYPPAPIGVSATVGGGGGAIAIGGVDGIFIGTPAGDVVYPPEGSLLPVDVFPAPNFTIGNLTAWNYFSGFQYNVPDIIIQSSPFVPLHGLERRGIDEPCVSAHTPRLPWLMHPMMPWMDEDLRMGSQLAHMVGHYAFNMTDHPGPPGVGATGIDSGSGITCTIEISLPPASGQRDIGAMSHDMRWNYTGNEGRGRWQATELDREGMCDIAAAEASCSLLEVDYPAAACDAASNDDESSPWGDPGLLDNQYERKRGNPNGCNLDIYILDNEPALQQSRIQHYTAHHEGIDPATQIDSLCNPPEEPECIAYVGYCEPNDMPDIPVDCGPRYDPKISIGDPDQGDIIVTNDDVAISGTALLDSKVPKIYAAAYADTIQAPYFGGDAAQTWNPLGVQTEPGGYVHVKLSAQVACGSHAYALDSPFAGPTPYTCSWSFVSGPPGVPPVNMDFGSVPNCSGAINHPAMSANVPQAPIVNLTEPGTYQFLFRVVDQGALGALQEAWAVQTVFYTQLPEQQCDIAPYGVILADDLDNDHLHGGYNHEPVNHTALGVNEITCLSAELHDTDNENGPDMLELQLHVADCRIPASENEPIQHYWVSFVSSTGLREDQREWIEVEWDPAAGTCFAKAGADPCPATFPDCETAQEAHLDYVTGADPAGITGNGTGGFPVRACWLVAQTALEQAPAVTGVQASEAMRRDGSINMRCDQTRDLRVEWGAADQIHIQIPYAEIGDPKPGDSIGKVQAIAWHVSRYNTTSGQDVVVPGAEGPEPPGPGGLDPMEPADGFVGDCEGGPPEDYIIGPATDDDAFCTDYYPGGAGYEATYEYTLGSCAGAAGISFGFGGGADDDLICLTGIPEEYPLPAVPDINGTEDGGGDDGNSTAGGTNETTIRLPLAVIDAIDVDDRGPDCGNAGFRFTDDREEYPSGMQAGLAMHLLQEDGVRETCAESVHATCPLAFQGALDPLDDSNVTSVEISYVCADHAPDELRIVIGTELLSSPDEASTALNQVAFKVHLEGDTSGDDYVLLCREYGRPFVWDNGNSIYLDPNFAFWDEAADEVWLVMQEKPEVPNDEEGLPKAFLPGTHTVWVEAVGQAACNVPFLNRPMMPYWDVGELGLVPAEPFAGLPFIGTTNLHRQVQFDRAPDVGSVAVLPYPDDGSPSVVAGPGPGSGEGSSDGAPEEDLTSPEGLAGAAGALASGAAEDLAEDDSSPFAAFFAALNDIFGGGTADGSASDGTEDPSAASDSEAPAPTASGEAPPAPSGPSSGTGPYGGTPMPGAAPVLAGPGEGMVLAGPSSVDYSHYHVRLCIRGGVYGPTCTPITNVDTTTTPVSTTDPETDIVPYQHDAGTWSYPKGLKFPCVNEGGFGNPNGAYEVTAQLLRYKNDGGVSMSAPFPFPTTVKDSVTFNVIRTCINQEEDPDDGGSTTDPDGGETGDPDGTTDGDTSGGCDTAPGEALPAGCEGDLPTGSPGDDVVPGCMAPENVFDRRDTDGDGADDQCDLDDDADGVHDGADNCASDRNPGQENLDGDALGDTCDKDRDGDGALDDFDAFPDDASEWEDHDRDGKGDVKDEDDDSDGMLDVDELAAGFDPLNGASYEAPDEGREVLTENNPKADGFNLSPTGWIGVGVAGLLLALIVVLLVAARRK